MFTFHANDGIVQSMNYENYKVGIKSGASDGQYEVFIYNSDRVLTVSDAYAEVIVDAEGRHNAIFSWISDRPCITRAMPSRARVISELIFSLIEDQE